MEQSTPTKPASTPGVPRDVTLPTTLGVATGALSGVAASLLYGQHRHSKNAVQRKHSALAKALAEKKSDVARQVEADLRATTEETFRSRLLAEGLAPEMAALRAKGEYRQFLEQLPQEIDRVVDARMSIWNAAHVSDLAAIEKDAAAWSRSPALARPLLAFKSAPLATKLGVVVLALGTGLTVGVLSSRNQAPNHGR